MKPPNPPPVRILILSLLPMFFLACGSDNPTEVVDSAAGPAVASTPAPDVPEPEPVDVRSMCDILTIADIQKMVPCLTEEEIMTEAESNRVDCRGRCTVDLDNIEFTSGTFTGKIKYYRKPLPTPVDANYLNEVTHKVEVAGSAAAYYSTLDGLTAITSHHLVHIQAIHRASPGGLEGNEPVIIATAEKVIAAL